MRVKIAIVLVLLHGAAFAEVPSWCADAAGGDNFSARDLKETNPRYAVRSLVAAACHPNEEAAAKRAEVEAARADWSKRMGMVEADWADAAAWTKQDFETTKVSPSTRDLAAASPLDQWLIILHDSPHAYAFYAADIFEPRLSELGRMALAEACVKARSEVEWAVCQADVDKLDFAKVFEELHADTTQKPGFKMKMRLAALELADALKEHAKKVADAQAKDEGMKKVWELAARARDEYASKAPANEKLVALVTRMDGASFADSKKLFEGCDDATWAALGEAVGKLPGKTFDDFRDVREDPAHGFASKAMPLAFEDASFHLAAIAVVMCGARKPVAYNLSQYAAAGPGFRGPRDYAFSQIALHPPELDKRGAKLFVPRIDKPYFRSGAAPMSSGGVVQKVAKQGDVLTITGAPLIVKREECVASHQSSKIDHLRGDGAIQYQRDCDRSAVVAHNEQWLPFTLPARYEKLLKPGVLISIVGDGHENDLIAVWPSAKAKHPSWFLGGELK